MFDIPNSKRVRREDLYTHSRCSSPSAVPSSLNLELETAYRARLASIYGVPPSLSTFQNLPQNDDPAPSSPEPEEKEFTFRLFKSDNVGGAGRTIVIRDKEEDIGTGAFLFERDRRFYFAEKATGERKRRFEEMAMSAEDVFHASRKRNFGLEVPWRVTVVRVSGKRKDAGEKELRGVEKGVDGDEEGKRKRPGKKRRIILKGRRKKSIEDAEKRKLEEERRRAEREVREEAEREKRTKRNREKKVKRKMKEKMKKVGHGEGAEEKELS